MKFCRPAFIAIDDYSSEYQKVLIFIAQVIAQPHELSFMSEKMKAWSMLQVIFVYIFIRWYNIFS